MIERVRVARLDGGDLDGDRCEGLVAVLQLDDEAARRHREPRNVDHLGRGERTGEPFPAGLGGIGESLVHGVDVAPGDRVEVFRRARVRDATPQVQGRAALD